MKEQNGNKKSPSKERVLPIEKLPDLLMRGILNAFVLALSITVFLVFLLGSYDFFKNVENNKCEMTWMFEYPEFINIKLGNEMDAKYPMYGLYAYAEGKHIHPAKNQKFTGIPVLFIPGNAGSHKQVRSFASVALRKWLDSKTPFHFDFFSVDFNEELSGLYGYTLNPQSDYTLAAIKKIQSFYEDYHSVVLIGHSMGGIVAKSMKEGDMPMSNLIFTLSSPHVRPILIFDPEQDIFYFHLSRNWTKKEGDVEKRVTLVSVAGGDRDHLVPEGLTKWGKHLNIHTTTTAVPGVWASTDHLCIVWCKQFVFSVVRSLFDLVEYQKTNKYYAISERLEHRQNVLEYHFKKRSAGKSVLGAHPSMEIGQPPGSYWNEILVHNYCSLPSKTPTYLMFPIEIIKEKMRGDPEDYKIVILTTNTEPKNWVFGCTSHAILEGTRYCSFGENLANLGEIIPHIRKRRKVIHLKYKDVLKYSHIIVKMDAFNMKSCVNLEVYNEKERSKQLLVKFDSEKKMFYNLTLPMDAGIFSKLFAWSIFAQLKEPCEGSHNALGIFKHGNFHVNRFLKNESLIARISDWNATDANVQLYLDPTCKYTINVRLASLETAGQMFRTYARMIPSFFASIVLMSLFFQKSPSEWINFHRVLLSNSYYLTIVPGFLTSLLLAFIPNDWPSMLDGPEYTILLPMFCYLVAYVFVLIVASAAWYFIIVSGNAVHAVFMRFVTSKLERWVPERWRIPMPDQVTDIAFEFTFGKFPVFISVFLVSLTLATSGSFGLAAGLVLYVVKLFKMYEDLLDDLWRARISDVKEGLSPLNFQFSCAMIWFVITVLNVPSLIHWVKNYSYDNSPQWDLSMYLCLMVIPTTAVLWQSYVPNFNPMLWKMHRYVFYAMGLSLVVWGTFRLYILGFLMTFVLITTAMCQLISSLTFATESKEDEKVPIGSEKTEEVDEEEDDSESEIEDSIDEEIRPLYENIGKNTEEFDKHFEKADSNSEVTEVETETSEISDEEEDDEKVEDETKKSEVVPEKKGCKEELEKEMSPEVVKENSAKKSKEKSIEIEENKVTVEDCNESEEEREETSKTNDNNKKEMSPKEKTLTDI